MSFSVTKLKANLTNFMHSCCDRALQEELVLLDARHKIKAAYAEPGPDVMETHSFPTANYWRRHPSAQAECCLHGDLTCGLTDVGQRSSTLLDPHCMHSRGTAELRE